MKKNLAINSLFVAFSLILSACANAAPTQDAGLIATQVAAQVEAQVATQMAQAMAAFAATQNALPTVPSITPTIDGSLPTVAPLNLPGVSTSVPCNPPPNAMPGETYPDGTPVYINTAFNKTWVIQNAGSCTWNANYKIKFASGDAMSGPSFKLFGASVPPGGSITLTLPLKTPGAAGITKGIWGLYDDKDKSFGWVSVVINSITVPPPSIAFTVTSVVIAKEPSLCKFSAEITATAAGTVRYYWYYSIDGGDYILDKYHDLIFDGANTKRAEAILLKGGHTYKVHIRIGIPNDRAFLAPDSFICP